MSLMAVINNRAADADITLCVLVACHVNIIQPCFALFLPVNYPK